MQGSLMGMKDAIGAKLTAGLAPTHLTVTDESDNHIGHSGWREGGETHFRVDITSPAFAGKSRVERHRMVNALLAEEFAKGMHALAVTTRAPGE
ncbi:BolA protein [Chelatococcus caeni]|uniref:BolA protein n=2 Tax=Chelatococcaceae TaxID=2036754 RepID=A0A840C2Z8_9HYPH|nr:MULTISPECIES: BolA family protein [Chelatococcus]ALA17581.1 BolA family transcriptional regulator [Chelatococcus sp. CO-6]MBB4019213.1 BolA protein [Chelatococcus caeni]